MASYSRIDELEKKFAENERRYFAPLANEYRKVGDVVRAIELCRAYLPQQPNHISGHIVFGQALYEAGELADSRTTFETALALDPENLIALRHLGDIARDTGELASAREWYVRVLEADPRNQEISGRIAELDASGVPLVNSSSAAGEGGYAGASEDAAVLDDFAAELESSLGEDGQGRDSATVTSSAPVASSAPPQEPEVELVDLEPPSGFTATETGASDARSNAESPSDANATPWGNRVSAQEDMEDIEALFRTPATPIVREETILEADERPATGDVEAAEGLIDSTDATGTPVTADDLTYVPRAPGLEVDDSGWGTAPSDEAPVAPEPVEGLETMEVSVPGFAGQSSQGAGDLDEGDLDDGDLDDMELLDEPPVPAVGAQAGAAEDDDREESPGGFVTVTMAELYVRQGYLGEAVRVYGELLAADPRNAELEARLSELKAQHAMDSMGQVPASSTTGSGQEPMRSSGPRAGLTLRRFLSGLVRPAAAEEPSVPADIRPIDAPATDDYFDAADSVPAETEKETDVAAYTHAHDTGDDIAMAVAADPVETPAAPAIDASGVLQVGPDREFESFETDEAPDVQGNSTGEEEPLDAPPQLEVLFGASGGSAVDEERAESLRGLYAADYSAEPDALFANDSAAGEVEPPAREYEAEEETQRHVADEQPLANEADDEYSDSSWMDAPPEPIELEAEAETPDLSLQPRPPEFELDAEAPTLGDDLDSPGGASTPDEPPAIAEEPPTQPTPPRGAPTRAATGEFSLDRIFRTPTSGRSSTPRKTASFSFDQFFSDSAKEIPPDEGEGAPGDPAGQGDNPPDDPADVAQFNNWLDGLKSR
jgi:tetratricopeptide (TPR) repeat protein